MTDYSGPERNTERRICGRVRAKILRDACRYCLNRVEGWDAVVCKEPGRTYPMCGSDGREFQFELDESTIRDTL